METSGYFCHKPKRMKKIIFGLLVIGAGALLIGFNMGYLEEQYKHVVFSWPMLLIAIGIINLFDRHSWGLGVILIGVGGFFLAPLLYAFPFNFTGIFWPSLLILAGLMIIIRRGFFHKRIYAHRHFHHHRWEHGNYSAESKLDTGFIDEANIFSGSKRKILPGEFKGGKITNIFGGSEIDLTQTTLAEGKNVLELSSIFGGVSIIVPSDWVIHIEVTSVLGGFVDKRPATKTGSASNTRELYIRGSAIFGGGEIKSL